MKKLLFSKDWKILLAFDLLFIIIFAFLSSIIGLGYQNGFNYVMNRALPFLLIGILYVSIFYIIDFYNVRKDFRFLRNLLEILFSFGIASIVIYFIFRSINHLRLESNIYIINCFLIGSYALFMRLVYFWFSGLSFFKKKALIIGANKSGKTILKLINKYRRYGFEAIGFIDDKLEKIDNEILGISVIGNSKNILNIIKENNITHLILATNKNNKELINKLVESALNGTYIIDMPSLFEELTSKIPLEHINERWYLQYLLQRDSLYRKQVKRFSDIVFSIIGLIVFSPLMLLISILIKADSKGKVFYKQERLGENGTPFSLIKFRTMFSDAEKATGPIWSSSNDSRVTRVGKILRKLGLDELPQLINVLKGDISLIGPRPEREHFVKTLNEKIPFYNYRLKVKPGITGLAQVQYMYASSLEQSKEKLAYDLYYIKNLSFSLDMRILLKTINVVLLGKER